VILQARAILDTCVSSRASESQSVITAQHIIINIHLSTVFKTLNCFRAARTRDTIHTCARQGEARRCRTASLATAHSNEYSSLNRFYNFESPSSRSYSRHYKHMREVRRGEARWTSARLAHHRRGEVKFASPRLAVPRLASRMCECPFKGIHSFHCRPTVANIRVPYNKL